MSVYKSFGREKCKIKIIYLCSNMCLNITNHFSGKLQALNLKFFPSVCQSFHSKPFLKTLNTVNLNTVPRAIEKYGVQDRCFYG